MILRLALLLLEFRTLGPYHYQSLGFSHRSYLTFPRAVIRCSDKATEGERVDFSSQFMVVHSVLVAEARTSKSLKQVWHPPSWLSPSISPGSQSGNGAISQELVNGKAVRDGVRGRERIFSYKRNTILPTHCLGKEMTFPRNIWSGLIKQNFHQPGPYVK